jgi:hypothetical protein
MKTYMSEGIAPSFLTSALGGDEWSASSPGCFTSAERPPGTHWIGRWVGHRAGLDAMEQRQIFAPCQESNPGRLVHRYTDWAIPDPHVK